MNTISLPKTVPSPTSSNDLSHSTTTMISSSSATTSSLSTAEIAPAILLELKTQPRKRAGSQIDETKKSHKRTKPVSYSEKLELIKDAFNEIKANFQAQLLLEPTDANKKKVYSQFKAKITAKLGYMKYHHNISQETGRTMLKKLNYFPEFFNEKRAKSGQTYKYTAEEYELIVAFSFFKTQRGLTWQNLIDDFGDRLPNKILPSRISYMLTQTKDHGYERIKRPFGASIKDTIMSLPVYKELQRFYQVR